MFMLLQEAEFENQDNQAEEGADSDVTPASTKKSKRQSRGKAEKQEKPAPATQDSNSGQ